MMIKKNHKKNKFAKSEKNARKDDRHKHNDRLRKFVCEKCGPNSSHNTETCWIRKREARDKASKAPFSKRTFRKEVNAMARRAGKNDGLKIVELAIKREKGKLARKPDEPAKTTKKKRVKRQVESDESDESSDESMHNMEARIPRKKRYRKTFEELFISTSDEESITKPNKEEIAFLKAIQKEEKQLSE